MKKILKFLALTLTVCLALLTFAGCASNGEGNDSGTDTDPADTDSDSSPAVLVMGTNAEFPPFEFITNNGIVEGKYDGIDVAIAKIIAEELGMELKIENMEFDSIIPSLTTGKVDIGIAGMTIKPDRLENVDFTQTYYAATQVMIVKNDSGIAGAADLKDKVVGVVTGYTGDMIVTDMKTAKSIERYKKGIDAVIELSNGKLDAVVIDSAPAEALSKQYSDLVIVTDSAAFENEEYAMAVKKGNAELLEKVDAVLTKLKEEGKIAEIAEKYLQAEEE